MPLNSISSLALNYASLNSPVVYHQNRLVRLRELLAAVDCVAKELAQTKYPHQYVLNLYEDRYYFLIGFLVALKHKTISLLPSTITPYVLAQLKKSYHDTLVLADSELAAKMDVQVFSIQSLLTNSQLNNSELNNKTDAELLDIIPKVDLQQIVAIIFTSGSTGQPKPYSKEWGDLLMATDGLTQCLFASTNGVNNNGHSLLATVPVQHMYGLEVSMIVALQNGLLFHSSKPFFPQDIAQCLEDLSQVKTDETTIITTPLHLKACLKTGIKLPGIKQFISATAPLETALAESCETVFQTKVMEVFGCTEVGSMAWRRTVKSEQWTVFNDINLTLKDNSDDDVQINTRRSIRKFIFNDVVELRDSQHFILKGRKDDLINLAGKRTSLAYLNHHLLSCEDLNDGCFFQPDHTSRAESSRLQKNLRMENKLIAFVVANESDKVAEKELEKRIRQYLKKRIESVFLPKKIYFIKHLARNATGKMPRSVLEKMLPSTKPN